MFLFEKCIIYTELFSKNRLQYRGHFRHVSLGFTFEDQRNYFRLYNERKGNQETEFSTDAQTIQLWIQMLNRTMTAVVQQEKKKIQESNRSSSVRSDLSPLHLLLQNSTPILQNIVMSPTTPMSECMMDMQSNSTDASYRNTGDYSNADTMSIKSGRKFHRIQIVVLPHTIEISFFLTQGVWIHSSNGPLGTLNSSKYLLHFSDTLCIPAISVSSRTLFTHIHKMMI